MLTPHITGELANTVDKHEIQSFARINNINVEELEKRRSIITPNLGGRNGTEKTKLDERRSARCKLAPMRETCRRTDRGCGAPNAKLEGSSTAVPTSCQTGTCLHCRKSRSRRNQSSWHKLGNTAPFLSYQAAEGDRAEDHCDPKGQMVCPGQRAPTANNKFHCRGQQETNALEQERASKLHPLQKNTMLDQPYERAARTRTGLPLAPPNSTCKVYQRNP